MKLVILRAGDAAPPVAEKRGQFPSWIQREVGSTWDGEWVEHDVRNVDAPLPSLNEAAGFIMTGSSSSVTERAPWMLRTESFLRELIGSNVPLFGICFGHQMIGEALGGKVAKNPRGREIGTVDVRRNSSDDSVMRGLPPLFGANTTHLDSVVTLPKGAVVLAETDLEPNAIYAIGETTKCVQFHPEFDGDVMRGYVDARAQLVSAEGLDPVAIRARSVDTPYGAETLRNFVRYVVKR